MSTDDDDLPPVPKEKLSKTPSWIMVGFVIGCIFAYIAHQEVEKRRTPPPVASAPTARETVSPPKAAEVRPADRLSQNEVDAIFRQVADDAVWEFDLTEIAVWNPTTRKFSDLVEVLRSGGNYYYRPIVRLTRPLITTEAEQGALVLFTETEALREKRLAPIPPILRPSPPKLAP